MSFRLYYNTGIGRGITRSKQQQFDDSGSEKSVDFRDSDETVEYPRQVKANTELQGTSLSS